MEEQSEKLFSLFNIPSNFYKEKFIFNEGSSPGFRLIVDYPSNTKFYPIKNINGANDDVVLISVSLMKNPTSKDSYKIYLDASKISYFKLKNQEYLFSDVDIYQKNIDIVSLEKSMKSNQPVNLAEYEKYFLSVSDNTIFKTERGRQIRIKNPFTILEEILMLHIRSIYEPFFRTRLWINEKILATAIFFGKRVIPILTKVGILKHKVNYNKKEVDIFFSMFYELSYMKLDLHSSKEASYQISNSFNVKKHHNFSVRYDEIPLYPIYLFPLLAFVLFSYIQNILCVNYMCPKSQTLEFAGYLFFVLNKYKDDLIFQTTVISFVLFLPIFLSASFKFVVYFYDIIIYIIKNIILGILLICLKTYSRYVNKKFRIYPSYADYFLSIFKTNV